MDSGPRPQQALQEAIERLLRPLFRLLLRHSVSFGAFADMAKRVYVDVARKDFALPGKKPTVSRIAVLSGLTRKDVQRLLTEPADGSSAAVDRYHRAARVVTGWARDADFTDSRQRPMRLETDGPHGFAALVKRYSGDMPARAVLDELLRAGAVEQGEDGRLELVTRAYVPQRSAADKLAILGSDVADLIATIDHNLQHGVADPRFQRKVMYASMPVAVLPEFRELGARSGQSLLEGFDRWLATHENVQARQPPPHGGAPRARVGMGIYYFEERLDEPHAVQGEAV